MSRAQHWEVIESAIDWLCGCDEGTDQRERGDAARKALNSLRRKKRPETALDYYKKLCDKGLVGAKNGT